MNRIYSFFIACILRSSCESSVEFENVPPNEKSDLAMVSYLF